MTIDLRYAFPHARPLTANGRPTLQDPDFNPGCGYVSDEEAAVLYETARLFPGVWCEIGSHTGWSGAHIVKGCGSLVALEPQFCQYEFFRRARDNWIRANVWDRVLPIAQTSDTFFADGGARDVRFSGCFIDGDHEPGKPLTDAQLVLPRMQDRCAVVFHDALGQPVQEAVEWIAAQGFQVQPYETMARLVVCRREERAGA